MSREKFTLANIMNSLKMKLLITLKLTTIWLFLEDCQRSSVGRATDS